MAISVNHNLMAANTARTLNTHYGNLATSTQRLSSGLRINSAADDAAGLAIRELMRADIAAYNQGIRNANDAISMIQVVDGALGIIDEKLIRMKELAEQAATGTYDSTQRLMIDSEFQAMASEIQRIATATDFNGIKLLDGLNKDYKIKTDSVYTISINYTTTEIEKRYDFDPDRYDGSSSNNRVQGLTVIERTLTYSGDQSIEYYEEGGELYKKTINNITIDKVSKPFGYYFGGHVGQFNPIFIYTGHYVSRTGLLKPEMIDFIMDSHPNKDFSNPINYNKFITNSEYQFITNPEWESSNLKGLNHKYTFYCDVLGDNEYDLRWELFLDQYEDIDFVKDNYDMSYLFYGDIAYAYELSQTINKDINIGEY